MERAITSSFAETYMDKFFTDENRQLFLSYPSIGSQKSEKSGTSPVLAYPSVKPDQPPTAQDSKSELIERLPGIMQKLGWIQGARVLKIWLDGGKYDREIRKIFDCNNGTYYQGSPGVEIQWEWYRSFNRTQNALSNITQIFNNSFRNHTPDMFWVPPLPQNNLEKCYWNRFLKLLKTNQELTVAYFDPPNWTSEPTAKILPPLYIGSVSINGVYPPDDLAAALNKHSLRLYLTGTVKPLPENLPKNLKTLTERTFLIDGIYLRVYDSFDFTGQQYLGNWSEDGFETVVSALNFASEFAANMLEKSDLMKQTKATEAEHAISKCGQGALFNEDFTVYKKKFKTPQDFHIYTKLRKVEGIDEQKFPLPVRISLI